MATITSGSTLRSVASVMRDYISLTKPRVMSLLLLTAFGGAVLAARGIPTWQITFAVLAGGALASGGASALNMWYEEELDQSMRRTGKRPVAGGRIRGSHAMLFGVTLNVLSFALLYSMTNILAASLAIAGSMLYVVLYTALLKRTTTQNIVIGGAAGAVPPLVGYAAVLGLLDVEAWFLFAIVFFWTPPHFWALSILIKEDYENAGIPMLPVVAGEAATRFQILLYTILMLSVTTLFYYFSQKMGGLYLISSGLLGLIFVALAARLYVTHERKDVLRLYLYSLLYLALVFVAIMVDASTYPTGF